MASNRHLRYAEFAIWVATVSTAVVAVCGVVSFVFGDGLLTLKYALFVVGFLMFGLGSLGIQPESYRKRHRTNVEGGIRDRIPSMGNVSTDSDTEYGFEESIQRLPPLRGEWLPLDDRVSRDWKLFAASLVVLGVSLWLEVGAGVIV